MKHNSTSRRDFVKQSALAAGSLIAVPAAAQSSFFNNSWDDTIKVALVGCGGRGTGAAMQALLTKQNVKLVAMADAFQDRLDECYKNLMQDDLSDWSGVAGNIKNKMAVTDATKFVGFDAYKKLIYNQSLEIDFNENLRLSLGIESSQFYSMAANHILEAFKFPLPR